MEFRTSDLIKLTYTDDGVGEPVILLSGYSGIKEEWEKQKSELLRNNYRVITLDWRNHGESMRTSKNLRIYRLAADVSELLTILEIQQAIFIGHSMGASAIWAYVSLFGEKHIKKIITIDQSPKLINDENWKYGIKNVYWDNFWLNVPQTMRMHMNKIPLDVDFVNMLKQKREDNIFDFELNAPLLANHMEQDWRDVITNIKEPQLFIAGEGSPLWSYEYANYCKKIAYYGYNEVLSKAGHLVHMEKSDEFNRIMLKFLEL